MKRDNEYEIEGRVRFSEIDHRRRMTLPAIINYFQDCSIFQSEELGYGLAYLKERKKAWMLSAWQIAILRYPRMGERIAVSTWASGFKGICGDRNFCMRDEAGNIAAYADSLWVYMDLEKKRPAKPGNDEISAYGVSEPLDMERADRKIELPEKMESLQPFSILRGHSDTNEHVNNCQYVQMALDVCRNEMSAGKLRVEYKKSAVYGNEVVPRVGTDGDRTVVELCGADGSPYAVVEFKP